jgi:hypothetical protein
MSTSTGIIAPRVATLYKTARNVTWIVVSADTTSSDSLRGDVVPEIVGLTGDTPALPRSDIHAGIPPILHLPEAIPCINVFEGIVPDSRIPSWVIILIVLVIFAFFHYRSLLVSEVRDSTQEDWRHRGGTAYC